MYKSSLSLANRLYQLRHQCTKEEHMVSGNFYVDTLFWKSFHSQGGTKRVRVVLAVLLKIFTGNSIPRPDGISQ